MRAAKSMVVLMLSLLAGCSSVVTQRYDVHDLFAGTVDYPYSPAELEKARNKKMHDLIDVISTSIGHESWRTIQYPDGGAAPTRADSAALGTITAKDGTLIISQRPEIQTQIASFLAILRQDRVQEVSIETRFMLVDDHFIENLGRDDPNRDQPVVAKTYSDIAKLFRSQSSRSGILGTLEIVPPIVEGSGGPEPESVYAAAPLRATAADSAATLDPFACAFRLSQCSFTLASSIHN